MCVANMHMRLTLPHFTFGSYFFHLRKRSAILDLDLGMLCLTTRHGTARQGGGYKGRMSSRTWKVTKTTRIAFVDMFGERCLFALMSRNRCGVMADPSQQHVPLERQVARVRLAGCVVHSFFCCVTSSTGRTLCVVSIPLEEAFAFAFVPLSCMQNNGIKMR